MTDDQDIVLEPEEEGKEASVDQKLKKLRDELKEVKKERDEYLVGWQRSKADYVNLSKRIRSEGEARSQGETAKLLGDLVEVFDSLEAAEKAAESAGKTVLSGIQQVSLQLESTLSKYGLSRFCPEPNDVFDPEKHEPVGTVATENENEDNTIEEVFQSGYALNGTTLRPARVSVKKFSN